MFPASSSGPPPPGVFVSRDQSEVTSPLSIAEWLIEFHAVARSTKDCIEGICQEGEVLHVPSGWWHLVVNLSRCIAITQNFVPMAHLSDVLSFLRDKSDQVSGFHPSTEDPYNLFVQKLEQWNSATLDKALKRLAHNPRGTKRKWRELVANDNGQGAAKGSRHDFSFSFGESEASLSPKES